MTALEDEVYLDPLLSLFFQISLVGQQSGLDAKINMTYTAEELKETEWTKLTTSKPRHLEHKTYIIRWRIECFCMLI